MNPIASATFIRRLREERERAGLSQSALAQLMSERLAARIDPSTITRMEKGERAIRLDDAVAAAEALELPLAELLSATGSDLNEQVRAAQFVLAKAEAAMQLAVDELELRQHEAESARKKLSELQEQEAVEFDTEVQQELAEELRSAQWPADS